jgi:hypothetical protein
MSRWETQRKPWNKAPGWRGETPDEQTLYGNSTKVLQEKVGENDAEQTFNLA